MDVSYNPLLRSGNVSALSGDSTILPDGKILIYRGTQYVNDELRSEMARLNADGALDLSFNCAICSTFSVTSAVAQPDGKILLGGFFQLPSVGSAVRRYRINADGSLDASFIPEDPTPTAGTRSATVIAATLDGKSYVAVSSSFPLATNLINVSRYNNDGSLDATFTTLTFNLRDGEFFGKALLLSDGKLLVGGNHPYGYLFRLNTDGSRDATFESPVLINDFNTERPRVSDIVIQADGRISFVGLFSSVNGVGRASFARLNANGGLDQAFNPNPPFSSGGSRLISKIALQPSGKLIVYTQSSVRYLIRFNADGMLDETFSTTQISEKWKLDGLGRIFIYGMISTGNGYLRLTPDGAPDPSFITPVFTNGAALRAIALQADGKAIISGDFTRIGNTVSNRLARLNVDGSPDQSFNSGAGPSGIPTVLVVQPDGKILVGGSFTTYNGTPTGRLIRLNSNGSLDTTFTTVIDGTVLSAALQADGKIVIGGNFTLINGTAAVTLARLNPDGGLDNSFAVSMQSAAIHTVIVQPDAKIVIGGSFSGINGVGRLNAARLNSDGSLDPGFNAGNINVVYSLLRQADGKYVMMSSSNVFRRNADGTADNTFQVASFSSPTVVITLARILLRGDGTIIAGGTFDTVNGIQRRNIVRLKPDGKLDRFFLQSGADGAVSALAEQADGKTLVGGSFKNIGGVSRFGLARVQNTPVLFQTPFDFDGDGRADISVFRPANGTWYQLLGANYNFSAAPFGISSDITTPADYDGDGKTDIAVFRNGNWYLFGSTSGFATVAHGQTGDIPLPADLDGDGRAELLVFRPSNGVWYTFNLADNQRRTITFGNPTDRPVVGDYDGDGKNDLAVYRPTTGQWFYAASSQNGAAVLAATWGLAADKAVPADYDGDGKTDAAIFRDGIWAIKNSGNASETILGFGTAGDLPVAADYDGDGRADIAVFRPTDGAWYQLRTAQGFQGIGFGANGDRPVPNAYVR